LNNQTLDAEHYYSKAINYSEKNDAKLYYAQMLLSNGKYLEAEKWFKEYSKVAPNEYDKQKSLDFAKFCSQMDIIKSEKPRFEIKLVTFNSEELDFSPFLTENGVFYCSNKKNTKKKLNQKDPWTDQNFVNLYSVTDSSGKYSEGEVFFTNIENKYHFGPACFSSDYKTIYFTKSNYFEKKRATDENYNTRLSVFYAEKTEKGWGNFKNLPFNSEDYSNCHPAVSAENEFIVFASDMPGGYGGMDLYIIEKNDTFWSTPVNLGETINTVGNEVFPFFDSENTLYFSSTMHPGLGGLDVFKSEMVGDREWGKPQNIGIPINSTRDDFGFVLNTDQTKGYFSSNRNGTDDNIYEFTPLEYTPIKKTPEMVPNKLYICGTVINAKYKNPLSNAQVTLTNRCTGDVQSILTDEGGNFYFPLADEACEYDILGAKQKFEDKYMLISTVDTTFKDCYKVVVPLTFIETNTPDRLSGGIILEEGMVLELYHVYFDLDKYKIRPDGFSDLVVLYELLKKYPEMVGELSGHTDCRNTHKYNETLSFNRAKAAREFLLNLGINENRILIAGYGETRLKNHCADGVKCSEEDHQRNRRVEFKVIHLGKTLESKETNEKGYFGKR
jgi:outer membrane protein OmpA-like peptidoglycan-associated protein